MATARGARQDSHADRHWQLRHEGQTSPMRRGPVGSYCRLSWYHTDHDCTGQQKIGQYRTVQNRTRPDRDRTGQDRTGQDRTGQGRRGEERRGLNGKTDG
ncbi:unnamed protein product [Protopolystoma xenopodis]|uniref:Uncharacterized protein n=1 Tax=Protopolystoma xenopodis TaxID=117903 RepID=A0A448WTB1_9PLAT|nr:unnamed protein product [Protopolystoma xenopodis]